MRAPSLSRAGAALSLALAAAPAGAADARHPLVIELFQSQGCSSCPPANANLFAWAARDDALALNFAVDYWDSLGWKDTFAKPAFTARQWAYAGALGHGEVYTPQAIVNGSADITGADAAELQALAKREDRGAGGPDVSIEAGRALIGAGEAPPAAPRCGSSVTIPRRAKSPSNAARTPAAGCRTPMSSSISSASAGGVASPRVSTCRPSPIRASSTPCWCRLSGWGQSSRPSNNAPSDAWAGGGLLPACRCSAYVPVRMAAGAAGRGTT